MANEVDDALSGLVAQAGSNVRTNIARSESSTPDPITRMLSIFQQAFPDQDFTVQGNGVVGTPKAPASDAIGVPPGYAPDKAIVGIQEMQKALESPGLTDEEKYGMAVRLNTMVQVQKMYKFNEYRAQSEAMYGIPDLLQTIEALKRAEATSPYNPGGGAMSQQRFEVLQSLGTARTAAAARVKDLMATDPVYAQAEGLAGGVISEIEGRLKIANRDSIIDERKRKKDERDVQIASIPDNVITTIGVMRNGKAPETAEERNAIASQIIDRKLKLRPIEEALAGADDDSVKRIYLGSKDIKDKELALRVLQGRETASLDGDVEQAKRNVKFYKDIMAINPEDKNDKRVTPAMRREWAALQQEAMQAKVRDPSKSEQEHLEDRKIAFRNKILGTEVRNAVFGDVKGWKGVIASDHTAQAVIKKMGIETGNKPLDINVFMDQYLEYNDGRKPQDKSSSLRAIITSAIEALPRSSVLPLPSADSALAQAEKMVLSRSVQKNFYSSGIIPLDLIRTSLPGNR